jgi:hypothetical protein
MTSDRASAAFAAFTLALAGLLIVFNLGRFSMAAQARKCHPETAAFGGLPFKGTLP